MAKQSCNMPVVIWALALFIGVVDMIQAFAAIDLQVNKN
jgi:hypothetical protein